jgi:hypothetical protein
MHVRFTPKADKEEDASPRPLCAKSGRSHCSKQSLIRYHRVGKGEQLPKRTLSEFAVVP